MIFRHSTTPGTFCRDSACQQSLDLLWFFGATCTSPHTIHTKTHTSCSRLLYSPSVFSLMIMMSIFLCRVLTPGRDWQCITLAYRSKVVLQREKINRKGLMEWEATKIWGSAIKVWVVPKQVVSWLVRWWQVVVRLNVTWIKKKVKPGE